MSTTTSTYALIKHARGDTPWDVEVNADLDTIDAEIARPRLPFNSPVVGATTTCDLSLARVFVFTVSQATTLAFTNVPSSSFACRIRLLITNGSAFVLTFPAAVTWLSGVVPPFRLSGVDEVELLTKDGGTTWYASCRPSVNLKIVGQTLTVTATDNIVDLAATWNTSGAPVGLKLNITDTASGLSAWLADLQRTGVRVFNVAKWGSLSQKNEAIAQSGGGTKTPTGYAVTTITVSDATAFTINPPGSLPLTGDQIRLTFVIVNSSGGAMGAITWGATYKFAAGAAPTNPATTKRRIVEFLYDTASANLYEISRSTGDL